MSDDLKKKFVIEKLKQVTVKVYTSSGFKGTGFFITIDGYILTAWHCIQEVTVPSLDSPDIYIECEGGGKFPARLEKDKSIKNLDIAVIKTETEHQTNSCIPLGSIPKNPEGDEVISVGYPGIDKNKAGIGVYSGKITRFVDEALEIESALQGKGQSGGLIYNWATHRIIGVVKEIYGGDGKETPLKNAGLAAKIDQLLLNWTELSDIHKNIDKSWKEQLNKIQLQAFPALSLDKQQANNTFELPLQDYKYDIFLSYRDYGISGKWVRECFKPLLEHCLEDELGEQPNIFCAKQDKMVLLSSYYTKLAYSRCLIPMWSPSYLELPWSSYECAAFKSRIPKNHQKLIFPVVISDGRKFHKYQFTHNLPRFDCQNYIYEPAVFKQSPKNMELQDKIREWVNTVVEVIESVPPWQTQWLEEARIIAKDFKHEEPNSEFSLPKMIRDDAKWEK
jgi:hypothetical protein